MTTFLPKLFLLVILITQDSTDDTDDEIFHSQPIKSSPQYSAPAGKSLHCVRLMSQCHLIYSCCCDPHIAICLPYLQGLISSKHSRDSLKGKFERQNDVISFVIGRLLRFSEQFTVKCEMPVMGMRPSCQRCDTDKTLSFATEVSIPIPPSSEERLSQSIARHADTSI